MSSMCCTMRRMTSKQSSVSGYGPGHCAAWPRGEHAWLGCLRRGGNRRRTAQMLGIGERTMYRKLRDYGLVEPEVEVH